MKRMQLKQRTTWVYLFQLTAVQLCIWHFILHHLDVGNCGGHSNLAHLNNSDSVLVVRLSKDISEAKYVGRSNVLS